MTRAIRLVLVAAVALWVMLAVGTAGAQGGNWKAFSDSAGGFSVLAPTNPVVKTRQFEMKSSHHAYGKMERKEFIMARKGMGFRLAYFDLPAQTGNVNTPENTLTALMNAKVAKTKGEVISSKDVTLGSWPGKETTVRMAKGNIVTFRMYLANHRCYELMVGRRPNKANSPAVARFLDSFKITGR